MTSLPPYRHRALAVFGALIAAAVLTLNPRAEAMPLPDVVAVIAESGGHYRPGGASLVGADCSGLVSVAQSLAMGQPVRRLGSTHTLLAGAWPHAIPGATRDDRFVIGVNPQHMVASIDGVAIEARQGGESFRVGSGAASPWDSQFTRRYRIDHSVLRGD